MKNKLVALLSSVLILVAAFAVLSSSFGNGGAESRAGLRVVTADLVGPGSVASVERARPKVSAKLRKREARQMRRQANVGKSRYDARVKWLASPKAKRARVVSRTKFSGLDARHALAAAVKEQPRIASIPAWHGPTLKAHEQIVRYESPTSALIKTDGVEGGKPEFARVESTGVPFAKQVMGAEGQPLVKPLDLTLRKNADSWSPILPTVGVDLPATVDGKIKVGKGLVLGLSGRSSPRVAGSVVASGKKVFYPAFEPDADAFAEPVAEGVSVSWVLRSPQSPEVLTFDLKGPNDAPLDVTVASDGSLVLRNDGGRAVGAVSAPVAFDAQKQHVEAKFNVTAGSVSVSVLHRDKDLAYPIAVDPIVRPAGIGYVVEQHDDSNPPRPMVDGWAPHTQQAGLFDFYDFGLAKGINIPSGRGGNGSGWFSWDPIRTSSAFRAEYVNADHLMNGWSYTCLNMGIYGRSNGFSDSSWAGYWTGDSAYPYSPGDETPWSGDSPYGGPNGGANGAFGNCSGQPKTFVQVCAGDCWSGGSPDNLVVFQVNASRPASAGGMSAYFGGAYIYHRELTAPDVGFTSTWDFNSWSNFAGGLSLTENAYDGGVGLCGGHFGLPSVMNLVDVTGARTWLAGAGNGNQGFCTGMTHYYPAPTFGSYTATAPQESLAEGIRTINVETQDAIGNTTTHQRQAKVDKTAPQIYVGGRLGGYTGERNGITGPLPTDVRTYNGLADATIEIKDSVAGRTTSGLSTTSAIIQRLDDAGNRLGIAATLFMSAPACAGQDNCDRPAVRIDPAVLTALTAGLYQVEISTADRAGNAKVGVFVFGKAGGEIASVVEGQATARWIPLQAKRPLPNNSTTAIFLWKTGTRYWQPVPGDALMREADSSKVGSATVPVTNGETGRYVLDVEELIRLVGPGSMTDLTNGQIQIRADFNNTGSVYERLTEDVAIRLDRGGRDTADENTDLGPGSVDMLTGNMALSATDAAASGYNGDVSVQRAYGSRYSSDNGLLGPGWKLSVPADETTNFVKAVDMDDSARERFADRWDPSSAAYDPAAKAEPRYAAVRVETADGSGFSFERRESDGEYIPELGFENYSLVRASANDGANTTSFTLTDRADDTTATFSERLDDNTRPWYDGAPEHGTFGITSADATSTAGEPRWSYVKNGNPAVNKDTQSTPLRVTAPQDGTTTCALTGAMERGCQALDFEYVRHPASGRLRLSKVTITATDPLTGAIQKRDLAVYAYSADVAGRLTQVTESRTGRSTTYGYDDAGLLNSVRESGDEPHNFTYESAVDDKSPGRVRTVSRPALPGVATWTVAYSDSTFGGVNPWDLSATQVAKWGQTATPFRAAAVFPPNVTPGTGRDTLQRATIAYMDAMGREVNEASPGGRISVADFDKWGNTVRTLTPTRRAAALQASNTQDAANLGARITTYEDDGRRGRRPIRVVGPERDVKLADGTLVRGRTLTRTQYDTNIDTNLPLDPDDPRMPFSLPSIVLSGSVTGASATGTGGTEQEIRTTKTEFDLRSRQPLANRDNSYVKGLFGRGKVDGVQGVLNRGDQLRIGFGWKGGQKSGHHVFRIAGNVVKRFKKSGHVDVSDW